MPTISPQAQAILTVFGQQPGVTQDNLNNLQAAINASPALIDQINDAVAQGHLKQITPLTNASAGGEYHPQTQEMRLPLSRLSIPPAGPFQQQMAQNNAGEMTFVLGHELQHGLNRVVTAQAHTVFANDVRKIAQHDPVPRDYTAPTAALLAQNRRDEAGAEVAGWNAVVSRLSNANPHQGPSLQDIYEAQPGRMKDFIDVSGNTYTLKPNLTLNPDMTLSATPANIEAMGQNYFDKQAKALGGSVDLGHHRNSDYTNYYGAYPVGFIARTERLHNPQQAGVTAPQMGLDMSRLPLNEKLLEENGINLGTNTQPIPYLDLGKQPPTAHLFQHTKTTHQHVLPIGAQLLEAEFVLDRAQVVAKQSPNDPNHPDHALLEKLQGCVRGLDRGAGKDWDQNSERLAASALVMARNRGFTDKDELQLAFNRPTEKYAAGEILHLHRQGRDATPDPDRNRAHMTTTEALSKPVEDRYEQVAEITIAQAQAQALAQSIKPDDPTQSGPSGPKL